MLIDSPSFDDDKGSDYENYYNSITSQGELYRRTVAQSLITDVLHGDHVDSPLSNSHDVEMTELSQEWREKVYQRVGYCCIRN